MLLSPVALFQLDDAVITTLHAVSNLTDSRPSDHYFRSVCLFVCLYRVFLSRL